MVGSIPRETIGLSALVLSIDCTYLCCLRIGHFHALLRTDPSLVSARGEGSVTLLHLAAERDEAGAARVLIEHGAELDARSSWGQTPLEWAANLGSESVADVLLTHGARGAPLWTAAALGRLDDVRGCFDDGSVRPDVGRTPMPDADLSGWPEDTAFRMGDVVSDAFYIACRRGHLDVARFLLDQGADVNATGYFGASAIHWAAPRSRMDVTK